MTYRQGGESAQTIAIRTSAAETLYSLAVDRLNFIISYVEGKDVNIDIENNRISIEKKKEVILNAFHQLSSYRNVDVCAADPDSNDCRNGDDKTMLALSYRQSLPELVKLTLELNYELLTILHAERIRAMAVKEVSRRMRFLLDLLMDIVHESQHQLVQEMTMDFLLTDGRSKISIRISGCVL